MAIGTDTTQPPQQDVAAGLHQPLTLHHPLRGVGVATRTEIPLEHRRLGLLDLHQQRVLVVVSQQQNDPRPGADTADADDLAGHAGIAEPVDQHATGDLETLLVGVE